jgi:hypothetical protein
MVTGQSVVVEPVEEVATKVRVLPMVLQEMVKDHQKRMSHSHQGPPFAASSYHASIRGRQVAVLAVGGDPSHLYQGCSQPAMDFGRAARQSFPGALFIARRHPGPTGQVLMRGEGIQVSPHLRQDHLRPTSTTPRTGVHAFDQLNKRARHLVNIQTRTTSKDRSQGRTSKGNPSALRALAYARRRFGFEAMSGPDSSTGS